MSNQKLGQLRFFPVPPELLHYRSKLTDPKKEILHDFTPAMKLIMIGFFELCNPLYDNPPRIVSYEEISDHINISVSTIHKLMPILLHNFKGKYFNNVTKKFGGSYQFEFCYNFGKAVGKVNYELTLDETINEFLRTCNDEDMAKWKMFERVPMDSLKSKWNIFLKYQKYDYAFWLRNISYAKSEFDRKKWKTVPLGWMYKCLVEDWGYSKLDKHDKKEVLNNIPHKKANLLVTEIANKFSSVN